MAKIHLDRLQKKYPILKVASEAGQIKGGIYSDLVDMIIDENSIKIQNRIANQSKNQWDKSLKKIGVKEKRVILPDITDILPRRSISIRKAAEKGKLLRDELRNQLTNDLRKSLNEFSEKTGQPKFITRRGKTAGRINPKLINEFQKNITNTFEGYTKKDPKYGIPKNIHGIAVTEVRSAVNEIKYKYNKTMLEKNKNLSMKKKWIQNKGLSKEYRRGHDKVHGKSVDFNEKFEVPLIIKRGGKYVQIGVNLMDHPHDPSAPLEQVINCNCDLDIYVIRLKPVVEKGLLHSYKQELIIIF